MPFDRFLIAPVNTGFETDLRPWLIPDDAFTTLQNAYVFRGRVRKRFGSIWMGTTQASTRLRVSLGNNTNAAMALPANTVTHTPQLAIGQIFSLGNDFFTVIALGAGVATLSTNPAVSAVIDSTVNPNTITFTGGALIAVFWYPSLPVMGLTQYESDTINNHPSYAFDTEFAYTFSGSGWVRSGASVWHGNDLNFFWATNWQGTATSAASDPVLFVSNFNFTLGAGAPAATDDPIWYMFPKDTWVAMLGSSVNGIFFLPNGGAAHTGPFVQTALIIVPFKDRLVLLNTVENDNSSTGGVGNAAQFKNRARYSFNGSPLAVNAWYEQNQVDAAGNTGAGGGFIDATTEEGIVSAEFIKDRLIVYFERSTWELVYTGNEILPFIWQKINTELGSQSTFSTVPFDKEVLTIGNTGVHSCNGANVQRIDNKIPDEIFDEFKAQNSAPKRTAGIRDYFTELVYWIYVDTTAIPTQTFPNQVLVYNYRNGSWAVNDDVFTAFGYFEQSTGMTWASSTPLTWQAFTGTWDSNVIDANHRQILAGNPEGFVLIIDPDEARNAGSMQITNITYAASGILTLKIINHNLTENPVVFPDDEDFILLENIVDSDPVKQALLNGSIWPVFQVIDKDTITINTNGLITSALQTYLGGGTAAKVSNIMIFTKQFNPYVNKDRNVYLHRVDFGVQKTAAGAITVDYFPSSSQLSMIQAGNFTGSIMGNNILETFPYALYPLETQQELLWHPIYFQTQGQFIQLAMYFSADQMVNPNVSLSDFELQGMCLYTQPTTARLE